MPWGKKGCNCFNLVRTALAVASALPEGESCTPMAAVGLPLRREVMA